MTLPLQRVVVHPDGAVVHRAGRVEASGGCLWIRALPLALDPSSVRLAVKGARVGEVEVDLDLAGEDRGPLPSLVEDLREAEAAASSLGATLEGLRAERDTLARLTPSFDGSDPRRLLPSAERLARWAALDDTLDRELQALDQRIRELGRARETAVERLGILRSHLANDSDADRWRHWLPTHRLRAGVDADGELEVELSYQVPGARWTPAYTLEADAGLQRGRFSLRALVAQATGEDWRGVRLTLTTAPVARRVDVPELRALRLGSAGPPPAPAFRPLPEGLEDLFPDLGPWLPPPAPEPRRRAEPEPDTFLAASAAPEEAVDWSGATPPLDEPPPEPRPKRSRMPLPPSAPVAAARSVAAMVAPSRSGGAPPAAAPAPIAVPGGGAHASEPVPEPDLAVGADLLDYGRLRLASFDAPRGARGRLAPDDLEVRLAAAGVSDTGRQAWRERRSFAAESAARVGRLPLPPRHVVPGPIEGTDLRFDAEAPADLPSDGAFHSVAVCAWKAGLTVSYRSVPRHDPRVFRRVEATLDHAGALLPGPVDVVVDGRLELTAPWNGSPGRGRLTLGLGAEDRLRLVRNVRNREESAGIFGQQRRLFTTVEVDVASSLQRPVRVELLDRLPVPAAGSSVTVELVEASPSAREYPGEPGGPILKGGRSQVVELPPGGEARATWTWSIALAAKEELEGGDRRG